MTKKLLLLVLLSLTGRQLFAQSNFYFTGHGRAVINDTKFEQDSEFVNEDTSSTKKALDGIFLFDLGVNIKPSDNFKASAILRISNPFGGFYSTGSFLEFRQVQIQGILARKVIYNIGDIDLQQSKYTLFNPYEPTYSPFEAPSFEIKRNLVEYDNFNNGNKWRLQGVQAGTIVDFNKYIEELELSAFGTRTRASDFISTPDRLLIGGSAKLKQSRFLELGGNIISLTDIQGTVPDTNVFYRNTVVSGTYKTSMSSRFVNFSLYGEAGRSFYTMNNYKDQLEVNSVDGFFDAGLNVKHRYIPVSIDASYRLVGPAFSSPGAQTRRIYDNQSPLLLQEGQNGSAIRSQTTFDRLSDLNLYNRSISATLMAYNPIYNNVLPYGPATPNRKGLSVEINYGHRDSLLYTNISGQMLSEVLGVGLNQKREFVIMQGGATLNLNKLLNTQKLLALSAGVKYESTSGAQSLGIDLSSTMIDAGLTVETLKRLDIIGGVKYFASQGSEVIIQRNEFNQIYEYTPISADITQGIYTAGLRYRFTNHIFFSANAFILNNQNKLSNDRNYQMNQYYFCYVMRF